jgi:hypothetical protein
MATVGIPLTEGFLEATNPASFARGKDVYVYERGTEDQVQLYADEGLTEPTTQPLMTDNGGRARDDSGRLAWIADSAPKDIKLDGQILPWNPPNLAREEDVAVLKEGALNVEYSEYGADGTGVADSTEALEKAIAALPLEGGEIYAPRKYKLSKELNLDNRRAIKIRGQASISAGASTPSRLIFTQTGAGALISARSSLGIVLEDVGVQASNPAFTGNLLNFGSDGTHGQNTYSRLTRVNLAGAGEGTANGTGLYIPNTADLLVEGCRFGGLDYAIKGEQVEADNSIGITIIGGTFVGLKTAGIQNAGESWTVSGSTVEALSNGKAGFLIVEAGIVPRNLKLDSIWMGDANSEGTWLTWRGFHFTVTNCTFGGGALALSLPESITTTNHVTVNGGCRFIGVDGIRANWGGGGGSYAYDFGPNDYGALSGKKLSLDNGATDLGAARVLNAPNIQVGGAGAKLGFFGKTPATRPNIKPPSEASAKEIAEALEAIGLVE